MRCREHSAAAACPSSRGPSHVLNGRTVSAGAGARVARPRGIRAIESRRAASPSQLATPGSPSLVFTPLPPGHVPVPGPSSADQHGGPGPARRAGRAPAALPLPPLPSRWWCGVTGPSASSWVEALLPLAPEVIRDASDRPWLFGNWSGSELRAWTVRDVRVVVLGSFHFGSSEGEAAAHRAVSTGDVRALASLPGSYHAFVSTPRHVVACGDAAGLRRLFCRQDGSSTLYGDHAVVLRQLMGLAVDDTWLATWLACPSQRHVLEQSAPFGGVIGVPPGCHVTIAGSAAPTISRSWRPPVDERPLAAGAAVLRERLSTAVSGRLDGVARSTCDLSGGLDSTTLAFLAAR